MNSGSLFVVLGAYAGFEIGFVLALIGFVLLRNWLYLGLIGFVLPRLKGWFIFIIPC